MSSTRALIDFVRAPGRATQAVLADPACRPARLGIAGVGVLYAAFCVWLAAAGHQPSFTGLPLPASAWYWAQAVFVGPLFWLAWRVGSAVSARVAGASAERARAVRAAFGATWSLAFGALYVVPDLVVFGVAGFDALPAAMRIYGPLALLAIAILGIRATAAAAEIGLGRASAAHLLGVLAQSVVIAFLLR